MKNIKILFIVITTLLVACDPLEDLKDEYQTAPESFAYTLASDDYETIADRILYFTPENSSDADFIKSNKYFTNSVASANYVPLFLEQAFPGKPVGSAVDISLNYNGDMPAGLNQYVALEKYHLTDEDYNNGIGYFSPSENAETYIPGILANQITKPEGDSLIAVKYVQPKEEAEAFKVAASVDEQFTSDTGSFTRFDVLGKQTWNWASLGGGTGTMIINGWSATYFDNEDWLVSKKINLSTSEKTKLEFENAIDFYKEGYVQVLISENFDGENVDQADWTEIEVPHWDTISDRTGKVGSYTNLYVSSGAIDLSAYDGKEIHLAFKYSSSKSKSIAPYWSIKNVVVGYYYWTFEDYYSYDGKGWKKEENVYRLTAHDYDQMGNPSKYDNFSSSDEPQNYIPIFLDNLYPFVYEGVSYTIVYNYYASGAGTITLADTYTKTDGVWNSSYSFVTEVVEPYKMSTDGWVFDPSVVETLSKDDFQIIVDYVNNNDDLPNTNERPENSENYYGASSYFGNFDIVNDGSWNNSVFGSWQKAVEAGLKDGYLPNKYPDATAISKGVEVSYILTFDIWNGSGRKKYTMTFKVSKDAPGPEFELISTEEKK